MPESALGSGLPAGSLKPSTKWKYGRDLSDAFNTTVDPSEISTDHHRSKTPVRPSEHGSGCFESAAWHVSEVAPVDKPQRPDLLPACQFLARPPQLAESQAQRHLPRLPTGCGFCLRQRLLVAASYCSIKLSGIRPRPLTAMPWSFAQARVAPVRSRLPAGPAHTPGPSRPPLPPRL